MMKYKEVTIEQSVEYDFSHYPTSGIWHNTTTGNIFYVHRPMSFCMMLQHKEDADKVFDAMRDEQIIDHLSKPQQLEVVQEAEGTVSESFALKLLAITIADKREGINKFDL